MMNVATEGVSDTMQRARVKPLSYNRFVMSQTPSGFMKEGAPIARLFRRINRSFYRTYEFDKHDYAEGGI